MRNLKITFVRKQNLSLFSFFSFISFLYNIMTKHNYNKLLHNVKLRKKYFFTQRYAMYSKRRLYNIKIINSMFKVQVFQSRLIHKIWSPIVHINQYRNSFFFIRSVRIANKRQTNSDTRSKIDDSAKMKVYFLMILTYI